MVKGQSPRSAGRPRTTYVKVNRKHCAILKTKRLQPRAPAQLDRLSILVGLHYSTGRQRWLSQFSIGQAQHATFGFVSDPVQERGFLLVWFCKSEPSVFCGAMLIFVDHAGRFCPSALRGNSCPVLGLILARRVNSGTAINRARVDRLTLRSIERASGRPARS